MWAKTTECSTKCKHYWRTYESNVPVDLPEAATSSTGPINPIPQTFHSPLGRRAIELSENLKLLKVQVQSAKSPMQGKQKVLDD